MLENLRIVSFELSSYTAVVRRKRVVLVCLRGICAN